MSLPEARRLFDTIHGAQLFSAHECQEIRDRARGLGSWTPSRVLGAAGSGVTRFRSSESLRIEDVDPGALHASGLLPYLDRLRDFALATDEHFLGLGSRTVQQAQVVRYRPGSGFWWHCDAVDPGFRKVSAVCYLDDVGRDGLRGGETLFAPAVLQPLLGRARIRRLLAWAGLGERIPVAWSQAPQAGRALVFPSPLVHRALPVESGEKYLLAMFLV